MPVSYAFSRKPGFHYGWDWAPRMVTCGVFKPVYLRTYDTVKLENPLFRNSKVESERVSSVQIFGNIDLKVY